jgi:hypothetical protein
MIVLLALISITASAQGIPPRNCRPVPWQIDFPNERVIDTSVYVKPGADVRTQEDIFINYFQHKDGGLVRDPERFTMQAFIDELYVPITVRMYADPDCTNKRCVAAIKITHGLGPGKKLKILYEPFYMRLEKIIPHPKGDSLVFKNFSTNNPILEYAGTAGKFNPLLPNAVKKYKDDYKLEMRKEPDDQGTVQPNPNKQLGAADVESIIFSFQEIIKFYHSVYSDELDVYQYCRTLEVHHGAGFYPDKYGDTAKKSKHTFFLTRFDWKGLVAKKRPAFQIKALSKTSEDDGANLGHLCPPRCADVTYPSGQ